MPATVEFIAEKNTTLRQRFLAGSCWSLLGALVARCSSLVTGIVIARLLSVDDFGKLSIITSTTLMFSSLASLGLGISCTRHVALLRSRDPQRAHGVVRLALAIGSVSGFVMALALFALAPLIAGPYLGIPELTDQLRLVSVLLVSDTLIGIHTGTLAGFEAFATVTRIGIVQGLVTMPVTIIAVRYFGIAGVVSATVASSLFGLLLMHRATARLTVKSRAPEGARASILAELPVVSRLALPVILSGVVVTPAIWLGNSALAKSAGGYGQLGIFNAANQWRMLLMFLPMVMGNVFLTLISSGETGENRRLQSANMITSWVLVTVPALLLLMFPEITGAILGRKYAGPAYQGCLVLLMLVVCMTSFKEGIGRRLITDDLMWWGVFSNVVWFLLFCALLWYRPASSALGLAVIHLVSYAVNTVLFLPLYLKKELISRTMVFSAEALGIWLVLASASLCIYFQVQLAYRLPLYGALTAVLLLLFRRLWHATTVNP